MGVTLQTAVAVLAYQVTEVVAVMFGDGREKQRKHKQIVKLL